MEIKVLASSSKGNCFMISDGHTSILIECGIPFKQIQIGLNFKLSSVSACFISHNHLDHCKAIHDLLSHGVDIYASAGTIEACNISGHRIHTVSSFNEIIVGTYKILPFDVKHDTPEPLGFFFTSTVTGEKLLFFIDTPYIKYKFPGCNYILAECNYSLDAVNESIAKGNIPSVLKARLLQSHMSIDHFLDMLKANDLSKAKQIYLLHLSNNNSREAEFKEAVQRLCGCEVYVC